MDGVEVRRVRAVTVLLAVAALGYCGVLWEALVGFPMDPTSTFLSELAATDQPTRWLFSATDLVSGLALLASGVLLLRSRARRGRRWVVAAAVALVVFGTGTVLDVLSPMPCAPSVDAACAAREAAVGLGFSDQIHKVTSVVADVAACVLALWVVLVGLRAGAGLVRRAAMVVGVAALGCSLVVSVLALQVELDGGAAPGVLQRMQTTLFSLTLLGVAPAVWDRRRGAPGSEPVPAATGTAAS